jgi:uncharacterized protein (TIGR00369 family)
MILMGAADDILDLTVKRYKNSFERHLGVTFIEYGDGYCEIVLAIKPEHLNIAGFVHGGIINALCDIALSGAVTSNYTNGAEKVVTMQMNVNFLRAGTADDVLTASGQVIKKGRTICYVEGGIKNKQGELIAKASGDWFVKS